MALGLKRIQRPTPGSGQVRLAHQAVGAAIAVFVAMATLLYPPESLRTQAVAILASWLASLIAVYRTERGVAGASCVYIATFGLFHGGLVLAVATVGYSAVIGQGSNGWINAAQLQPVVPLVCVALAALVLGSRIGRPRISLDTSRIESEVLKSRFFAAGIALILLGFLIIANELFVRGSAVVTTATYADVLDAVGESGLLGYGTSALGVGCGLLVASKHRLKNLGWFLLGISGVVLLPFGFRAPILFPLATLVVVQGRVSRVRAGLTGIGAILVLSLISAVRSARLEGIAGLTSLQPKDFSPVSAIAEMGYSLYPVVVVERWMAAGEASRHGVTLIAPFVRAFEEVFGREPPPGASDSRLFNVEIFTRVGPIGGSPVAEGLRNGGFLGMVILMLAIGFLIGTMDRLPNTTVNNAYVVILLLPLLIQIRNSFAPVLVQWTLGLFLILALRTWPMRRERRGAVQVRDNQRPAGSDRR